MKVLYLINYAGKAGTERYVENLIRHLHPHKARCGLCYNVDGPLAEKMRQSNIPTHRIEMRHMLDFRAARELAQLCKREGYDVIHAQYPRENSIALPSQRIDTVLTENGRYCAAPVSHKVTLGEIVELLQSAVAEHHLEHEVTLAGSFCIGKCNRIGVTVQVDDEVHVGVTKEGFKEFFQNNVLAKLR